MSDNRKSNNRRSNTLVPGSPRTDPPRRSDRSPWLRAVGIVGELLITAGVILALFVVYQVWWTDLGSARKQSAAEADLERNWGNNANPRGYGTSGAEELPADGTAFARLYIPAFGADYRFAVVAGTSDADLEIGPGYYTQTQRPGEPGNFAVAGHRVGRGAPFNDLDALVECDAIVYETETTWFIYRVLPIDAPNPQEAQNRAARCMPAEPAAQITSGPYTGLSGRQIVSPTDIGVIAPIPGRADPPTPGQIPLATLTTCHPQYSAAERMVVHAALVRSEPRAPGQLPAEMRG